MGTRAQFPVSGGQISLTQSSDIDNLNVLWYKGDNPERFHAFSSYTNTITDISSGHYCQAAPDFKELGFSAGDKATLLLIYALDGQDTMHYQCADVELVDVASYNAPAYMCGNYTTELNIASEEDSMKLTEIKSSGSTSNPHTNSVSQSSSDGGLTVAQGGGIGAGATAAFFVLLLGALYAVGRVHFGKRHAPVSLDDASSTSSVMKQRI
jgi:hypothetical protein